MGKPPGTIKNGEFISAVMLVKMDLGQNLDDYNLIWKIQLANLNLPTCQRPSQRVFMSECWGSEMDEPKVLTENQDEIQLTMEREHQGQIQAKEPLPPGKEKHVH